MALRRLFQLSHQTQGPRAHTTHSGVTRATILRGACPRVQRMSLGSPRVASPASPNTVSGRPWTDDRMSNAITLDPRAGIGGDTKIGHDRPVCYPLRIYIP